MHDPLLLITSIHTIMYGIYRIVCMKEVQSLDSGDSGVDLLGVVGLDLGDLALLKKVLAGSASKGAVDLQTLNKGGRSDELHLQKGGQIKT